MNEFIHYFRTYEVHMAQVYVEKVGRQTFKDCPHHRRKELEFSRDRRAAGVRGQRKFFTLLRMRGKTGMEGEVVHELPGEVNPKLPFFTYYLQLQEFQKKEPSLSRGMLKQGLQAHGDGGLLEEKFFESLASHNVRTCCR